MCTERCALQLYLHKYFCSFSAAELNNIESEDKVSAEEFSCKESDYGDSHDEDIEQLYIFLFFFSIRVFFHGH